MRYSTPSPFEEISHTADVGIRARGRDLEEVYSLAVLAMAQLQAGGGAVSAMRERQIVARGEDRASLLVDLCRQVLSFFFLERWLLAAIEIGELTETRLAARCTLGDYDRDRHAEGMDIKAVTYARAAVEGCPAGGFEATLIFDI